MLASNRPGSQAPHVGAPQRIVYLGMTGLFSMPPLEALLKSGHDVAGVVVPAAGWSDKQRRDISELKPAPTFGSLPIVNPYLSRTIKELAWEHSLPVFEILRLNSPATLDVLAALRPDVGCVACFSRRLPLPLLELPRYGFLNVHPSLLPAYRGPAPLFWALHDGAETGVTVHAMNAGMDTGDILAQRPVQLPDGSDADQADRMLASVGGELLVDVLQRLQCGPLLRQPQPEIGTPAPWPHDSDFEISAAWSVRRAYNFMCATAEWGRPYLIQIGAQRLLLGSALAFSVDDQLAVPFQLKGDVVRIQLADGVLDATTF